MLSTRIIEIDPRKLLILEDNARYMTHEQYSRLIGNIKRDGQLSSVPFVWKTPKNDLEVLSGNHRVRAAVDAGLKSIHVMVAEGELTKDQRVAIQLSHNAMVGQDDQVALARLYSSIDDIDLRAYSGLDDGVLSLLADVEVKGISELNLEMRTLLFVFLPHEIEKVKALFDEAMALAPSSDEMLLGERSDYDRLLDATANIEKLVGIRNRATALRLILSVFEKYKHELEPVKKDSGQDSKEKA